MTEIREPLFQRILVYMDHRSESLQAAALGLRLAQLSAGRVFAVEILNPLTAGAPKELFVGRSRQKRREPEEAAWRRLYEIEEDAFEADVRISLLLERGDRDDVLLNLIASYQLDVLIIGSRTTEGWEQLIARCPVTVILAR